MPEGDVLRRTAAGLDAALAGRVLDRAELRWPDAAGTVLEGRTVLGTVAYGKHLLTRFDDGRTLHTHLRMEGSWSVHRTGTTSARERDPWVRAVLVTPDWTALGHRLGMLDVLRTRDEARPARRPRPGRAGRRLPWRRPAPGPGPVRRRRPAGRRDPPGPERAGRDRHDLDRGEPLRAKAVALAAGAGCGRRGELGDDRTRTHDARRGGQRHAPGPRPGGPALPTVRDPGRRRHGATSRWRARCSGARPARQRPAARPDGERGISLRGRARRAAPSRPCPGRRSARGQRGRCPGSPCPRRPRPGR